MVLGVQHFRNGMAFVECSLGYCVWVYRVSGIQCLQGAMRWVECLEAQYCLGPRCFRTRRLEIRCLGIRCVEYEAYFGLVGLEVQCIGQITAENAVSHCKQCHGTQLIRGIVRFLKKASVQRLVPHAPTRGVTVHQECVENMSWPVRMPLHISALGSTHFCPADAPHGTGSCQGAFTRFACLHLQT